MCDDCYDSVGLDSETPVKDVMNKWIEALESGDYAQTRGALGVDGLEGGKPSFCCLGVLCELAVQEGIIPDPLRGDAENATRLYGEAGNSGALPVEVRKWAGLATNNGTYDGADKNLVGLNDSYGYSFEQIASVIREKFLPRSV